MRFPPSTVHLGPLTRKFVSGAVWEGTDKFPAWQDWADEVEEALNFLERESHIESFFSVARAGKTPQHRDACLAKTRAAPHLRRNGFRMRSGSPPPVKAARRVTF